MRCKRLFSVVLLLGLIFSTLLMPAAAYKVTGFKWGTKTINYYYDNYVFANAKNAISTATSSWNGSNVDATLRFSASPINVSCTDIDEPTAMWDGLTRCYVDPNTKLFTSQSLLLNMAATETWNSRGALNSVACHEFGHVFGLNENGTTATLMNSYTWGDNSRWEGYGISSPTSDDIRGVNSLY